MDQRRNWSIFSVNLRLIYFCSLIGHVATSKSHLKSIRPLIMAVIASLEHRGSEISTNPPYQGNVQIH